MGTTSSQRDHNLFALMDLCGLMSLDVELDALLTTVITLAPDMLRAEESSIILVTEDRTEMVFHMASNSSADALKKVRLKYGEGIAGAVITSGKPAIVNELATDPRHCKTVDREVKFQTRNLICTPIRYKESVVGALTVVNKLRGKDFDNYDLTLLEAIASQAGIAIERSRLIEENLQSARMAAIGETVAGLAHCVKNIVTGLTGGQFVVNTGLERDDLEIVGKGWGVMERNISRISSLAMDMLTYSTDREPELGEVDLDGLVDDVVELLQTQARVAKVEIQRDVQQVIMTASLDPNGIYRCLVNLVRNAIEACDEGGVVRIQTGLQDDGTIVVTISDDGCGMAAATLDDLFVKIFSTKGSRGTGFGLPTTHKIINEHGGSITAESKVGEGSTFTVKLPQQGQRADGGGGQGQG